MIQVTVIRCSSDAGQSSASEKSTMSVRVAVTLVAQLFVIAHACSTDQPLDAVFVVRHKKTGMEAAYKSQTRWVSDSAKFLGIGVMDRDTQIGLVSDENHGEELTCITTDLNVLEWQLNKQAATTANTNSTAKAINMAATLLPLESRASADQVRTA